MRSYSIKSDTDPAQLRDAPISALIKLAAEHSGGDLWEHIRRDPLQGELERRPRAVFLALAREARQQQYPVNFWPTLLTHWPQGTSLRARWCVAARLARLPPSAVLEMVHPASDWFRTHLPALAQAALERALDLWDPLLKSILEGYKNATRTTHSVISVDEEESGASLRSHEQAINSPIGRLTEALLETVFSSGPAAGTGIHPQ